MLASNVLTRRYDEFLYVMNTRTNKSYVFNGIAVDIITFFERNAKISEAEIVNGIADLYDADINVIEKDVRDTVVFLNREGLLEQTASTPLKDRTPEEIIDDFCMKHHILTNVMLEMTYRCNERCKHCYTCDAEKNQETELTTEEYKRLLDELKDLNVREIVLTGGEIGLRRDFSELYEYMIAHNFWITLMTNGTSFTQEQMDMLINHPPKVVYISFYGGSAAVHDSITQVTGSFDQSLFTLMKLKCAGITVCMKTVAMELNKYDFPNIVNLARKLHVGLGTGMFVTAGNNGSHEPVQYRLSSIEDYREIIQCKQKYDGSYTPWRERDVNEPICEMGASAFSIDPYGNYRVCPALPINCGNVRTMGVQEFWNTSALLKRLCDMKFSELDETCVACKYRDDCVYCVGANYVETGKLIAVSRETCLAAQAFHEYFEQHGKH